MSSTKCLTLIAESRKVTSPTCLVCVHAIALKERDNYGIMNEIMHISPLVVQYTESVDAHEIYVK